MTQCSYGIVNLLRTAGSQTQRYSLPRERARLLCEMVKGPDPSAQGAEFVRAIARAGEPAAFVCEQVSEPDTLVELSPEEH